MKFDVIADPGSTSIVSCRARIFCLVQFSFMSYGQSQLFSFGDHPSIDLSIENV
jgi:hypothetical protein